MPQERLRLILPSLLAWWRWNLVSCGYLGSVTQFLIEAIDDVNNNNEFNFFQKLNIPAEDVEEQDAASFFDVTNRLGRTITHLDLKFISILQIWVTVDGIAQRAVLDTYMPHFINLTYLKVDNDSYQQGDLRLTIFSEMRHSNRLLIRNSQENIFGPITNPYNAFVQFFFNDMDKPNNNRLYQSIRNRSYPGRGLDCSYEPRERNPTINYHLAQPYTTLFKIRFHTSATTMILQDSIYNVRQEFNFQQEQQQKIAHQAEEE